jgi:phosphohistidine swiveling domain-containing protein
MHCWDDRSLVLPLDSPAASLELAGGKGASLARLAAAGLPVPPGFHLTTAMYRRFVDANQFAETILAAAAQADPADPATLDRAAAQIDTVMLQGTIPADIAGLIRAAYEGLNGDDPPVAVRSSATAEDLPGLSFAGQQETYLNVRGAEAVLDAVKHCWSSLWTARALGYRARHHIRAEDVTMAVVVQQLVAADVAGILFTANPLTGARDETVINAAWGLGEAIVSGRVTPDQFVVDPRTGAVQSQIIADKEVMTVRGPTGTSEAPVPEGQRRRATLQPPDAARLAQLGAHIAQLYGQPMDVEWAKLDEQLFILQARPITALPEPATALVWSGPRAGRYFRASVVELLPEPLSPLFASLALPLWNGSMRRLATTLALPMPPTASALTTINGYAYYELGMTSWQMVRVMLVIVARLRSIFALCFGGAQRRWAEEARPHYARVVRDWQMRDPRSIPAVDLLDGATTIVHAAADHYLTIQSGILPVAYTSETLFTMAYNRLLKRKEDEPALTFMLGFDSMPMQAEQSLYDLARWAGERPGLAGHLLRSSSRDIVVQYRADTVPEADLDRQIWRAFCDRLTAHLDRFGHAVYDLDFAVALAVDDPAPLIQALRHYLGGEARDPHERQAAAADRREQATQSLLRRLGNGLRGRLFRRLLPWAQRYAPLREDALADVGLGWPVLRRLLLELGRRLVAAGGIAEEQDVFWLTIEEARAAAEAVDGRITVTDHRQTVVDRQTTSDRLRAVTPPLALPVEGGLRLFGIDFSALVPAQLKQLAGDTITGQGASPGRVDGIACVVRGPGEFGSMRAGEILVAKITTPAWTPLFALAAGIVTDVGGPLSHGSIVAREYHIPAVLGTGVATERIRRGERLHVDGDRGTVKIG